MLGLNGWNYLENVSSLHRNLNKSPIISENNKRIVLDYLSKLSNISNYKRVWIGLY
jgi:hypothetical protein